MQINYKTGLYDKNKTNSQEYSFGLDSFGDLATGKDGKLLSYAESIRLVVDEGVWQIN